MSAIPSATERDLRTFPLRNYVGYAWRQPEPTDHAYAWRVLDDLRREIAAGQADTLDDALRPMRALDDAVPLEEWDRSSSVDPECAEWLPQDVQDRLTTIAKAAAGMQGISQIMQQHLHELRTRGFPLTESNAAALAMAGEVLASTISTCVDGIVRAQPSEEQPRAARVD